MGLFCDFDGDGDVDIDDLIIGEMLYDEDILDENESRNSRSGGGCLTSLVLMMMPFIGLILMVGTIFTACSKADDPLAETSDDIIHEDSMDEIEESYNQKYKEALMRIYKEQIDPVGDEMEFFFEESISDNGFLIIDYDLDGTDELLINWSTCSTAGAGIRVYEWNSNKDAFTLDGMFSNSMTVYDNGVILDEFSHNQGLGRKLWPYNICEYDASTDSFFYVGYVDSWDKDIEEYSDWEVDGYPEEYDDGYPEEYDDGSGTVYVINYKNDDYEYHYSKTDLDMFMDDLIGDANEIDLNFLPLTEENIESIE